MAKKEKGSFDMNNVGVTTRNILHKKVVKDEKIEKVKEKPEKQEIKEEGKKVKSKVDRRKPEPKKEKTETKKKKEYVRTSYLLKKEQLEDIKRIAFWTREDFAPILRELIDHGIEVIRKKKPELLKPAVDKKKELF